MEFLIIIIYHNLTISHSTMASGLRDYMEVFTQIPYVTHDEVIEHLRCCPGATDGALVNLFGDSGLAMRRARKIAELGKPSSEEVLASAAAAETAVREVTEEAGGCKCKCKGTRLCYAEE